MDKTTTGSLIYVIEDEEKMRDILRINLTTRYNVRFFRDAERALSSFNADSPELIVTDVRLPGINGIQLMSRIKNVNPGVPFIVFTGYGSIDHAVDTMKKGAFDYLVKPIKIEELVQSIDRALSYIKVSKSSSRVDKEYRVTIQEEEHQFVTCDHATIQMLNLAQKAACFRSPILIIGETGTGKELIARFIHQKSGRKGPFVKLNCASIPHDLLESELFGHRRGSFTGAVQDYEGKIALSDGGTLFLDEIGELPLDIQAKLLHVLEIPEYYPVGSNVKKAINLFLITATNRNLRHMVDQGGFRNDLFYRIAVIPIKIPPLRERRCDILPLTDYFLKVKRTKLVLSPEAKLELLEYRWPGNVRELVNVLERAALLTENSIIKDVVFDMEGGSVPAHRGKRVEEDIPESWQDFKQYKSRIVKDRKEELEKRFIEKLLIQYDGNVSETARNAGIDRRQLQDMIRQLNIDVSMFRKKNRSTRK
jgi:two-component system response regulator AtoC